MAARKRASRSSASASKQLVLPTIQTEKRCSRCGEVKPITDFGYRRSKQGIKRFASWCKACECAAAREWQKHNPEKVAAKNRRWVQNNPERKSEAGRRWAAKHKDSESERSYLRYANQSHREKRVHHLAKTFGMTLEDEAAMRAAQGGVCAICGRPPTGKQMVLDIDHDHKTGIIRGLLCGSCNRALGLLKDDVSVLEKAIAYLKAPRAGAPVARKWALQVDPPSNLADPSYAG
jgi:hypothetical protein